MASHSDSPEVDSDRQTAAQWANEARRVRESVRASLRSGDLTLPQFFGLAETDELFGRIKVLWVLESLPDAKKVTTRRTLDSMGIDGSTPVSELEPAPVAQLLKVFDT